MKLFVGNLSFDTTENDLQDAFEAFGKVTDLVVMQDRMTGRSRGFGFVTMSSAEEAEAATRGLNDKALQGRNLIVNEARPREEGGGQRFGGGNRNGGNRNGGGRNFARR